MVDPLNPQREEMADESMVRNLAAQADAIWPQEQALFTRYGLPDEAYILDAGCGTGEISRRLAGMFGRARLLGVDVIDDHLERARSRCAAFGDRTRFEHRSIFELELPDRTFDLVVCRHVLQSIPQRRPGDRRARARHEARRPAAPDRRRLFDDQFRAAPARP